jgi:type VI protein secretion system component Hcp
MKYDIAKPVSFYAPGDETKDAGVPQCSVVTLQKPLDDASCDLMDMTLALGKQKRMDIEIVACAVDSNHVEIRYVLGEAVITEYKVKADGQHPTEDLTVAFQSLRASFTPVNTSGKKQAKKEVTWSNY